MSERKPDESSAENPRSRFPRPGYSPSSTQLDEPSASSESEDRAFRESGSPGTPEVSRLVNYRVHRKVPRQVQRRAVPPEEVET